MLHSAGPLPYAIEYAKLNRSYCKKCKKNIGENSLRMSLNQKSTYFDGTIDSWFHYECFWQNLARNRKDININSIRGVDWLNWEDQELLRNRIQKFREPVAHFISVNYENVLFLSSLKSESSLTNRGKCIKCSANFEKGEMKVIFKNKYIHFKCHAESFDRIEGELEQIPGWNDYEECWRERVIASYAEIDASKKGEKAKPVEEGAEKIAQPESSSSTVTLDNDMTIVHDLVINLEDPPEIFLDFDDGPCSSTSTKKRAAAEEIVEINPSEEERKKRKLGKAAKMAELQKRRMKTQVDQLWECRQLLEKLSHSERLALLAINFQEVTEGHDPTSQLIDRLADYAVFGVPIACLKCTNGNIVYNSARRAYVCTGYATEYSKCTFESKNPVRTPFKPTDRLLEKCSDQKVVFNAFAERLYIEEEEDEEVVKIQKRKSKGGLRGDEFIYAAEALDSQNVIPISTNGDAVSNTHIIKHGTVVDAKFPYANRCHVFKNEEDGSLYQATLSFTDVTQNKNSYYKIQLLKDDIYESYYVFRSWGRVGTDVGNHKSEGFDRNGAVEEFKKIFRENTKNNWEYRKHFRKMPGAFSYVETDYSEFAHLEQDVIPGSKTKLTPSVKEVVMSIFDIENMKSALKSFEMDVNKMPLGRLSRNQINLAFEVLNDLSELLIEFPVNNDKILDSTNKFYTIIPHNFGMKVPEPINSIHKVKEKNNMLNALLDIKFAYDQICGGESPTMGTLGVDPVDTNYLKLKCAMTPLDKHCSDYQMIHDYLKNTQGSTHEIKVDLIDILQLNRESESKKFKANIGNRRLLWHGSGRMNFAGILGQGLRIAPPEAPASGYMFGKGVYFADMFSKSFFYCRANCHEEAYLLLCDVALGEMATKLEATTMSKSTLPKGTHSVKGVGRECPIESGDYLHPDGYIIPRGKKHFQLQGAHGKNFHLLYNEYIVYDVDQIQMKYLVRVKMHHARHR
ncbi:hypothetical protein CRE_01104 [Caenorhabditis remanei]|uniref:Poly [ADP-ribose] polymerase n=1 Tax=Caenorhabditis remanei TaxID=31234 RepID=E3MI61_CAERE|nr:hypothetical protein CRE_01104 [Caenorhabditis remanei]